MSQRFEIRIAGFGGQGVVTIGRILGTAFSVYGGKNSVNTQSYGPESRGGACRSEVVISDKTINYPYVRKADVLIALSQPAFDMYKGDLKAGGILVIDPQAVSEPLGSASHQTYEIPTMEIARRSGGVKFQNSVALGALYAIIDRLVDEAALRRALSENVPADTIELNMTAFEAGKDYVKEHYTTGS